MISLTRIFKLLFLSIYVKMRDHYQPLLLALLQRIGVDGNSKAIYCCSNVKKYSFCFCVNIRYYFWFSWGDDFKPFTSESLDWGYIFSYVDTGKGIHVTSWKQEYITGLNQDNGCVLKNKKEILGCLVVFEHLKLLFWVFVWT